MTDLAEKILEEVTAKERRLRTALATPTNRSVAGLCDLETDILRCAADREMVEIYKGALVAVEVSRGTILAAATKIRLGAYQKMIDQLARGYGIQP